MYRNSFIYANIYNHIIIYLLFVMVHIFPIDIYKEGKYLFLLG